MKEGFLYGTNVAIIQCVFFALMLVATEVGFRLGRKSLVGTPAETWSPIATVEAALLGVLALLLGFTMSMAVSRFETRRQLVIDEANAIGTSLLCAQLLPAPEGPEIAKLLREYINVRVQYGTSGNDFVRLDALHTQTKILNMEIWTRATGYAQKDPNPVKAALLLQSLNQTIDLQEARWAALQNRVPQNVISVNAATALLAVMLVGYSFGMSRHRNIFSTCVLALAITLLLGVIIDLDRPRSGFIGASQQPMIDLLHEP